MGEPFGNPGIQEYFGTGADAPPPAISFVKVRKPRSQALWLGNYDTIVNSTPDGTSESPVIFRDLEKLYIEGKLLSPSVTRNDEPAIKLHLNLVNPKEWLNGIDNNSKSLWVCLNFFNKTYTTCKYVFSSKITPLGSLVVPDVYKISALF